MAVDTVDLIVLVLILAATILYFTKGTLWGGDSEKYPGGSQAPFGSGVGGGGGGLASSKRDIIMKMADNSKNMVVFYGSQTGTAEDYASRLAKEASQRFGLKTMTADVDDFDFENLDEFPEDMIIAFVMATYGEGEPTDNAVNFYEFITSPDVEFSKQESIEEAPLKNVHYVVFGLGNSTYEHFNSVGKTLDSTLEKLGATRVGPYGQGDDGLGTMEEDYLAWKDDMFPVLKAAKNLTEHEAVYEPSIEIIDITELTHENEEVYLGEVNKAHLDKSPVAPYNATNPHLARVVEARELFQSESRNCVHLELEVDPEVKYTTGDHLAFWPQNSNQEVERFLTILSLADKSHDVIDVKTLDPTAKVPFPVPTTYDTVVRYYLEINGAVSRQFLSSIAAFAPSEEVRAEVLKLGSDKAGFAARVTQRMLNIGQLLSELSAGQKWEKVPFAFIVESIQHLQPRYYSISSSSMVDKQRVSITAVVESIRPDASVEHELKGVATNYILDIKHAFSKTPNRDPLYMIAGPRGNFTKDGQFHVPVHVRHSNFKLPSNPKKPIIMVGPGTGVAPFRGFIHERAVMAAKGTPVGKAILFFGCRTEDEDNLYAEEWKKHSGNQTNDDIEGPFNESNFLNVVTAFSRQGKEKVYVQHRMLENAELIDKLLKNGAYFYVCGDANRMAREVQQTLAKIISEQRGMDIAKAEDFVKSMKTQNAYQEDVW